MSKITKIPKLLYLCCINPVTDHHSLWKSSTSQEVIGADTPLEAFNTMAGSIPCKIIDGSFLSRRSKGGLISEVSERAIVWCEVKILFAENHPELRG
jgi:hypothetical protein